MSKHEPNETGSRHLGTKVGGVLLTFLAAVACMGFAYWMRHPGPDLKTEQPRTSLKLPTKLNLFAGWETADRKPDFVLVLTAEQHGYLSPCGCSDPQKGGLERRYNFMQILRDKGWSVVAVDLGDIPQTKAPTEPLSNVQQLIKYRYSMMALKEMDYTAVGIGPIEANNLLKFYGEYALQLQPKDLPRVVSANLRNREKEFTPGIEDWATVTPAKTNTRVGVTSVWGAFNAERRPAKDSVQFDSAATSLKALKPQVAKTDFHVLLYEGFTTVGRANKSEAVACAEAFPEYQVVLALSGEMDEPSGTPIEVKDPKTGAKSLVITLGHKSKYIGVVGVFKTGNKNAPYDLRYQLVELGEEYKTPEKEVKDHPIIRLMEEYTAELKDQKYLAMYQQRKHPLQIDHPGKNKPEYAGSDQCKQCHATAFKIWKNSEHSKAYQTLVAKAKLPANRQFDPECIVCHTVGFGYESGFENANKTANLKDVGCESCHGPSSEHIQAEFGANGALQKQWRKVINPWKDLPEAQHKQQMEQMCMKCHDLENDVHWTGPTAFDTHWDLIKHYKAKPPAKPSAPVVP